MIARIGLALLACTLASFVGAEDPMQAQLAKKPQWKRLLTGADAKRAEKLETRLAERSLADNQDGALESAEELLALRTRLQGADHWETVDARYAVETVRRVRQLPADRRKGWRESAAGAEEAERLEAKSQHERAAPLRRARLKWCRDVLGENHPETAIGYHRLAANCADRGLSAEAETLYRSDLAISRAALGTEDPDTATSCESLAEHLAALGRFSEAEPLHREALEIRRRVIGDDDEDTADSFNDYGSILGVQGKHAEAEPLIRKALEIRKELLGEMHADTITSHNNVAFNLKNLGRHEDAERSYRTALDLCVRKFGRDHPETALVSKNLGLVLDLQGRPAEAEPLFRAALAIVQRRNRGRHAFAALIHNNLGYCLVRQDKVADAEKHFRESLEIQKQTLGEDHWLTADGYHALALNLLAQGKVGPAEACLASAVPAFESSRLRTASGFDRASLELADPRLLQAALLAPRDAEAAWAACERTLARALLEQTDSSRQLDPADRTADTELREQLGAVDPRILDLAMKTDPSDADRKRLDGLLAKRLDATTRLATLTRRVGDKMVASPADIRRALSPTEALVYWIDVKDRSGAVQEHWGCVVRDTGPPRWERLPGTGRDRRWWREDSELPDRLTAAVAGAEAADIVAETAQRLHAQRIAPLAGHLVGVKTLHVVGVHWMAGVPLDAIAADYAIHHVPSGTFLARLKGAPNRPAGKLLVLGDPTFPTPIATTVLAVPARGSVWKELPGTAAEVARLRTLVPDHTALTRADASAAKLDALRAGGKLADYRYLHFATHGEADGQQAFQSALILHGDGRTVARLTAREILDTWKLDAELVTLSACETAIGKSGGGDGLLGFAQAFLTAGARSVCLSLWKVDDAATALLMGRFYENLLGKREGLTKPMGKSAALDEAKRWLRGLSREEVLSLTAKLSNGLGPERRGKVDLNVVPGAKEPAAKKDAKPFAHPKYWAAFILIGDPN